MRGVIHVSLFAIVLSVLAGCGTIGGQPYLSDAAIKPATLSPGDTALVTVHVVDAHKIVNRVVAVVIEDSRMKFNLADDGQGPDSSAGDGVWSMQVDVPFMAPKGSYTLEFTAYDQDGQVIMVKDADLGKAPLSAVCELVIEHPAGAQS
jgi:hypothetical protein